MQAVSGEYLTDIIIPLPFQNAPYKRTSCGRISGADTFVQLLVAPEPGGEKAG